MKQKIAFIINPFSGSVKKRNIPEAIEKYLDLTKYDYEIIYTEYSGHAIEIAKSLSTNGTDIICAVGGDGSLHEIGNGIMNDSITLAVLPVGSGNGIATHLGYKPRNLPYAFDIINTGFTTRIDVGTINQKKFYSVFGVGIDGHIAYEYKHRTKRSFFAYASLVTKQLLTALKFHDLEFTLNGVDRKEKVLTLCGFNSDQFGYSVGIVPWASAKDGLLEVAILKKFNPIKLPWITFCLLIKKPTWISELELHSVTELSIKKNELMKFQMDGDPFIFSEDLHISLANAAVKFIVPKIL